MTGSPECLRGSTTAVSVRGNPDHNPNRVIHAWRHHAIEIDLRKGGASHRFLTLQFLADGHYVAETGEFLMPAG